MLPGPTPFDILPRSPCSLLTPFYQFSLLLSYLSLSPAPVQFFLLLLDNSSCSLLHFPIFFAAPCSLSQIFVLPAPRLRFPCSLPYFRPCSLLPSKVSRAIRFLLPDNPLRGFRREVVELGSIRPCISPSIYNVQKVHKIRDDIKILGKFPIFTL